MVIRILNKKGNASSVLADMLPILLAIVLMGVLAIVYASWASNFEQKETINSIVREYLLRMETVGCLNEADTQMLKQELADNNMYNITLNGTTFQPVENGERVVLKIKGQLKIKQVKFEDFLKWDLNNTRMYDIDIKKTTTAIY